MKKEQAGVKVVNFLKFELNMSTRLTRKLVLGGYVTVNGKKAKNSTELQEGDVIDIILETQDSQDIEPEDIPVEIVYEDMDLLIVNKPPFMVVHPTKGHPNGTLANAVMHYFRKTSQNCIVRLINRLDRDTSGLVVIAKSQFAHQAMAKKLDSNSIEKYYIAVVEGMMTGSGTIDLPIDRPSPDSIKREVMDNGQKAVTHYQVLSSSEEMSKVLIRLETGRTHQIRVHLSHIGHPIIGDTLYGAASDKIGRQALHAYKLKFKDLRDEREIEVVADIPEDIKNLMENIDK
ncbi:hypothetical protein Q428_04755 [Fervidicella metallireducens AeB]|uniref:Pseudouridine synthase n=1 Tax=Fervidicella metallireducens AeB TaxID=1403537 RepID=A0A017RWB5_9CLOT|nr:hypothetical protein Q428_04755 [Fervidicella metallireducens AeB]